MLLCWDMLVLWNISQLICTKLDTAGHYPKQNIIAKLGNGLQRSE